MALDLTQYKLPTVPSTVPPAPGGIDLAKYKLTPPAQARIPTPYGPLAPSATAPTPYGDISNPLVQAGIGFVKGRVQTLQNIGNVIAKPLNAGFNKLFGQNETVGIPDEKLKTQGAAQKVGDIAGAVAEFAAPAGIVGKAEKAVGAAIKLPGLAGAAGRVLAKAGTEGAAAGGVSLAQTADPKTAGWTAVTAGLLKTGTGTVGEVLKGSRIPEWLYSKVFKTTYDDMHAELKTGGTAALQKSDPELYKTLVDRGIIKTAADGNVTLDETLAKQALDKGLKGGLHNMANVTVANLYKNELAVQDIAANAAATVKVPESQFESVLRDIGARYQDVGFGDFSKRAMDLADKIKTGSGELSVQDALSARRLLDGLRASSSFGETPPTLSLGQKNLKFLADALRSRLAKVPGMGDVMKDYSFNIDALEALSKEAARRGNNQVISLIDSVLLGGGVASANPVTGSALYAVRKGLNQPAVVTRAAQAINRSGTLTKTGAAAKGTLFEALKAVTQ